VAPEGGREAVIHRAECLVANQQSGEELLGALEELAAQRAAEEPGTRRALAALIDFSQRLACLIEVEKDEPVRARLATVQQLLSQVDLDLLESRDAVRRLQPLRRELKSLERGSSRRVWSAIKEHAPQARLSKELASLQLEAPVQFQPEQLGLAAPSRRKAFALFQSLGFRALSEEYAPADAARGWIDSQTESRGRYEALLTAERLRDVASRSREAGRLVVATELDGPDPLRARLVGIALSHTPGEAFYVPLSHDHPGAPPQLALDVVRELLAPILSDPGVAKIAHDLKHQSHALARSGLPLAGFALDTMVAAFLLNSSRASYALDSLAEEYLGYAKLKGEDVFGVGQRQLRANQLDVEPVMAYAAEACDITLRLAQLLERRLQGAGLLELYESIDGPLLPVLAQMERRGIRIDVPRLQRMSLEMEGALGRARQEIHELAGVAFNVDSPKQLREVLFGRLGLRSRRRTVKSGEASTDAQALEELAQAHPIAQRLLEYREMSKLKGTYVDSLPRLVDAETARVHTTYHPTGAATGRLSSSDPNLQNIPVRSELGRRIREAFVPEAGHLFLACDYSQIELRVLAHMAGDAGLAGAFRAGEDIHRHTAARIFGVDAELVTPTMRRRAKAVNFGVLYGMSETRLAREQGISRVEAHRFIEAYFARFGAVRAYIESVRDSVRREGLVRTLFGRVRLFPQLQQRTNRAVQEQALRAAVNATIQGTAADLMKLAMVRVAAELERTGCPAHLLLQVHDELLLEVPEDSVPLAAETVKVAMEQVHPLRVPLTVDQKVGRNWLEMT
jgi:DNA polymerase-1